MNLFKWFTHKNIHDIAWDNLAQGQTSDQTSTVASQAQRKSLQPTEQYELSIAVNAAVNAICRNLSKGKLRVFTRTGREVTGGPLFDLLRMPAPQLPQKRLIWEISAWLNIAGEFFINLIPRDGTIGEMVPLAPTHIDVHKPTKYNRREDVIQWRYRWTDGTQEYIRDDHLMFERLFNPNARSIRGLSPLVTGAVNVSGSYYAERYNKSFFENGAIPSHIVKLPSGTPKLQRDAFTRQYLSSYQNFSNNGHKIAVVSGDKDFTVEQLEQPFQDGAFMEMMKRGDLKVGQLYRVPAINMGIYDKTRFDTANEERKLFLEETLEPQAEIISEAFQHQLIDPYFKFSTVQTGKELKEQNKGLQKQFEKAEAERRGPLMILLDLDSLPIKNEVMLSRTEFAMKLREAYDISARAAEEFVGIELDDDRPERDEIFVPNNRVCITNPKLNEQLIPGVKGGEDEKKPPAKEADVPAPEPDALLLKAIAKFLRDIRKPTFESLDNGGMWSLEIGYKIAGDETLKPIVRRLRHDLRKLGEKKAIRSYLSQAKPHELLPCPN